MPYLLPQPRGGYAPVYPVDTLEASDGFAAYLAAAVEQPGTAKLFEDVLGDLEPGSLILENGAGHGTRTVEFLEAGLRVVASEPCPDSRLVLMRNLEARGFGVFVPNGDKHWQYPEGRAAVLLPYGVQEVELPGHLEPALRLDRHLLYHVQRSDWTAVLRHGAQCVRRGGLYWATLKSFSTSDNQMLDFFGLERFYLDDAVAQAFRGDSQSIVQKITTRCRIVPESFEHAVCIALFFLSDAAASGILTTQPGWQEALAGRIQVPWNNFLEYVGGSLWQKEWIHDHDHFFIRPNTAY